jgi:hypothetical protein
MFALPERQIIKRNKAFGLQVESLAAQQDGDIALDSKDRKTLVEKRRALYTVTQFDANYKATTRDHYSADVFEQNYRWYI